MDISHTHQIATATDVDALRAAWHNATPARRKQIEARVAELTGIAVTVGGEVVALPTCRHEDENGACDVCRTVRPYPNRPARVTARLEGHCEACDSPVARGQEIAYSVDDDQWVHADCVDWLEPEDE